MRVNLLPIHPDLAMLLRQGDKTLTMRPVKPQPSHFDPAGGTLCFGSGEGAEITVYTDDFPCPHGRPGDLLVFYFEGNNAPFYTGKITAVSLQRLLDVRDEQVKLEGMESRAALLAFWDLLYGETEFASHFNPLVWAIRYCKG
ncbi:MAG: hypothetical protein MOGMAGMI_01984 [Candidatus Omnitrophica bacterium]|nr:hypothetical protein [Candidatus Omnitrophota bacterium]